MKHKFLLIFISSILLLSLASAALDQKVKVKSCEIALSDTRVTKWEYEGSGGTMESSIFKPWNEITQEGIFITSNNTGPDFGQTTNYVIEKYTSNKT
jgi:hypothetical protein